MGFRRLDTIEHIQRNIAMYLGRDHVAPDLLAIFVAHDALTVGAMKVHVSRRGLWWIVAADIDWLSIGHEKSLEDLFRELTPLVGGGLNAVRREPLLMAFAERIIAGCPGDASYASMKGECESSLAGDLLATDLADVRRVLAFEIIESGAVEEGSL